MAVPSVNEFLIRFPEFGEQSLSVVEQALTEAALQVPEAVWGYLQTQAIGHLAAHILALRTVQIGQQVGTLSGNPTGTGLAATLYGQQFQTLGGQLPLTGFVV